MLDTDTKPPADTLDVRLPDGHGDDAQLQALADIQAGRVHSVTSEPDSDVLLTDADGTVWTVTETVRRLEAAGLAERVEDGVDWRLTTAGTLALKRQTNTDEPMTAERLTEISAAYNAATGGPWYFETQYGPYFLASEVHGYMRGIGQLEFGEGAAADRDRAFVLNSHAFVAELLDEVERLNDVCNGCEDTARSDAAKDRELEDLRAENARLRHGRVEDRRGRYLDSEGIGAGAGGNQLITWGGDIDQIEVRPSPHGGKTFLALGMLGLDRYESPETCPQVRVTLTDGHARELADGIYASLDRGGA